MKKISIFGSTGSIGKSTIEVITKYKENFDVIILTCNKNYKLLIKQAKILKPKFIAIKDKTSFTKYKEITKDNKEFQDIIAYQGEEAINDLANIKCDLAIYAISGTNAIWPIINSIKSGSNIASANKESIIAGWKFIKKLIDQYKINFIPIDSEHNSLFQITKSLDLTKDKKDFIDNMIITASGGPFLDMEYKDMKYITKKMALSHPIWSMGDKITIDSATMVNKSLEIIEAAYLFDIDIDKIDAVIHRESIIHAMISYKNAINISVMNEPDMKIPIAYSLFYPKEYNLNYKKFNLANIANLSFKSIDHNKFKAVNLAKDSVKKGGNYPIIFNIANEIAVAKFLKEEIKFLDIVNFIEDKLNKITYEKINNLDDIRYYQDKLNI